MAAGGGGGVGEWNPVKNSLARELIVYRQSSLQNALLISLHNVQLTEVLSVSSLDDKK